jgi:hypothetical protein
MSRDHTTPRSPHPPGPDLDLDEVCDRAICEDGPASFGIVADHHGVDLAPGDGFDLPEDLLTSRVPRRWRGVVIVAEGRCRDLEDPASPSIGRARFAYALSRQGDCASLLWTPEGAHRLGPDDHPGGHVVDVAHRLLGLDAPPEPTGVVRLIHVEWLTTLVELASAPDLAGCADDWAIVAAAHPCADLVRRPTPDGLGRTTASEVEGCSWEQLHASVVADAGSLGHLPPAAVARLDGPSFARFALASRPRRSALWAELCALLDRSMLVRVRRTMAVAGDDVDALDPRPTAVRASPRGA